MPRKYEKVQELLPVVRQLAGNGWTQRQIAEKLGLSGKEVVKGLLKRERQKEDKIAHGIMPCSKGRPRKKAAPQDIVAEQAYVTDISYIRTGQGFLFLSIIRDLYDNSIVAYKTGSEQNTKLVLDTIRAARRKEKVTAELQLHSDQGFPYTSQAYFKLTQRYGITPSMSRRGNPYDNALAENFFSILKTECICRTKIAALADAKKRIDDYIFFYNNPRIQTKTKLTPLELRRQFVA